jgi:hypothetical protein
MPELMKAVERKSGVARAVQKWWSAFNAIGTRDHGFDPTLVWIEELGIWLNHKGRTTDTGFRYWNGLGTVLGGQSNRNLVVEVNPPENGSPPGRFQGVIAKDVNGDAWVLHRGELNAGGKRVNLRDFSEVTSMAGFDVVKVSYLDGSVQPCYRVASLGNQAIETVSETKKFIDLCGTVRALVIDGAEEADVQYEAGLFEEPTGPYTIGPKEPQEIARVHGEVFKALRDDLVAKGFSLASARVGSLGPDLYTKGKSPRILFEIKTGNGASDILKAVGQLIVYERLLKKAYRRVMVLPSGVNGSHRSLIESLDIEVIDYVPKGKSYGFNWPKGFLKAA